MGTPIRPDARLTGLDPDASRAMIAGLNAVALLGSFMHAVGDLEKVADLAAGGLAALARVPLAAIAWHEGTPGGLRVSGTFSGGRTLPAGITAGLKDICGTLPQHRPSSLDVVTSAHPLRRAGVQEVLSVPLRVSNDCLGFLLAGGPRGSIPVDLTLVQVLGAQTSTALYVARLQQAEAGRAQQMAELADGLRRQSELLARALRLQEELIDLVLLGRDATAILQHLGRELGASVWLLDDECRVVAAYAGPEEPPCPVPGPAELRRTLWPIPVGRGPQLVEMAHPDGQRRPFLAQSVSTDRETFGYLLVGSTALAPVDLSVFQGGRLVLALRLLVERSIVEAEDRAGRELLSDALQNRGGARTAAALAARLGYHDAIGPAVVLAARIRSTGRPGRRLAAAARRAVVQELGSVERALVGSPDDDVVAILRPDGADLIGRQVVDRVRASSAGLAVHVGISDADPALADLARAHREAVAGAVLAERAGVPVLCFGDLGLHKLMFDITHRDRTDEHVERWIGPLLRYDEAHRTCLRETLTRHLCGENQHDTARALSIHPSTLKYRLGRIREVLGVDFTRAEVRFNIELALRLQQCTEALAADDDPGPAGTARRPDGVPHARG